jgi:hypothetical protein
MKSSRGWFGRWGWVVLVLLAGWVAWGPHVSASSVVTAAYNLVQQAGTPLVARTTLNCSTGMSCSDDAINKVTTLTATGTGGSVTQVNTGCGLSGGPITTTGTIISSIPVNAQTGASYAILNADCGHLVTLNNSGAVAVSIAQAGSGGNFASGWSIAVENLGAGTVTITPATSTIDGAATLTLTTNQGIGLYSDGANYFTVRGRSSTAGTVTQVICGTGLTGGTITSTGTCAIDANSQVRSFGGSFDGGGAALTAGATQTVYYTMPFACTITGYNITADAGTVSFDVWKVATGTAIPTVGNSILTGGFLALSSGTALHSTSVTLFTTTTVTAFDIIGVNLEAVATATKVSLVIPCNAT